MKFPVKEFFSGNSKETHVILRILHAKKMTIYLVGKCK